MMANAQRRGERRRARGASLVAGGMVVLLTAGCGARVHPADLAATDPTMTGPPTVATVARQPAPPEQRGERVAGSGGVEDEPSGGAASLDPLDATAEVSVPVEPASTATDPSVLPAVASTPPTEPPVAPATPATPAASSDPAGADPANALAEAIDRADGLTYHASYRGQTAAADGTSTATVVEIWNRSGATLRTVTVSMGAQRLITRQYRTTTGRLACIGAAGAASCRPVPGSRPDDGAAIAGAVDPASGSVTVMQGSVDGIPATCFHAAEGTTTPGEACFDADGVPLVIADGGMRVVRTELDAEVTDGDVLPPAA